MARTSDARYAAAEALLKQLPHYPDMPLVEPDLELLSPPDAALAVAIHRTTLRRLLTLQALVDRPLSRPFHRLEAQVQAALLTGAAQLAFFDRTPGYAAVDQAVELVRALGKPGAVGMVNAVLRSITRLTGDAEPGTPWRLEDDAVPLPGGGRLPILEPEVLSPVAKPDRRLAEACSLHRRLTKSWIDRFGLEKACELAEHSIQEPPTIVAMEPGFAPPATDAEALSAGLPPAPWSEMLAPHESTDGWVYRGPRELLSALLRIDDRRSVQDPSSAATVGDLPDELLAGFAPRTVLDLCAGRGAKTRQLAQRCPDAQVFACDPDDNRFASLLELAEELPNVTAIPMYEVEQHGPYGLVLVDAPCSNTGVLARRLEARYRYHENRLGTVVALQREIVQRAASLASPEGVLVYATCSLEAPENRKQVDRLVRSSAGGWSLFVERQIWPGGSGSTYRDGAYRAVMAPAVDDGAGGR
ncbi:MAG: transcription antitermination factor NusB [Planctomycetota bacterium]